MSFRTQMNPILIELGKLADHYSEQWVLGNDPAAMQRYDDIKAIMMDIKQRVKDSEDV